MICLHLNPLPKLKMGVVKVPYLDKLSEPQVSTECNHENPVSGIYYICTVTLRTLMESFIDTDQDTSRGREGWGQNGKNECMGRQCEQNKLSNKSAVKFLRLPALHMIRCGGHWPACPMFNLAQITFSHIVNYMHMYRYSSKFLFFFFFRI